MKIKSFLLILPVLAAVVTSCGKTDPEFPEGEILNPGGKTEFSAIPLTKSEQEMTYDIISFAFKLFKEAAGTKDAFISPYSASLALSLLGAGASGNTSAQINRMLGFDGIATEEMNSYYAKLTEAMVNADSKTALESANSLWVSKVLQVKRTFFDTADNYYDSEVFNVDFSLPSTLKDLNKWCSDKTHGRIPSILDSLDPQTRLMIANALYFKSSWAFEFKSKEKEKFHDINGGSSKLDMMKTEGMFSYAADDKVSMVALLYGNGAFEMDIILPHKEGKEAYFEALSSLDGDRWKSLTQQITGAKVILSLPEFTFDYDADLIPSLKSLGMTDAFNPKIADFSNISDHALYVSLVKHKAFIDVNINGTEAAAVTVIGMKFGAADPGFKESDPIVFTADRPFIYVIRERSTGTILFIGQKLS